MSTPLPSSDYQPRRWDWFKFWAAVPLVHCRLSYRAIAQASAPSEAAQTRLGYINGIRDDLLPVEYEDQVNLDIIEALLDALHQESGAHLFRPGSELYRR